MKEIQLTKGYKVIVDDEDYERLNKHKWQVTGSTNPYAIRREGPRPGYAVWLHKEVLQTTQTVDHINHNTLDNRRDNLRLSSKSKDSMNRGLQSNNTSGCKGVSQSKGRWQAYIKHNGKKINLGTYDHKEVAARAYDRKATELFGEFAVLNNIPITEPSALNELFSL